MSDPTSGHSKGGAESAARGMGRLSARGTAVGVGIVVYVLAFTSASMTPTRLPLYEPLARRWVVASSAGSPASPAIDWYGRLLRASVAGGVAFAVTHAVARRFGREPGPGAFLPQAVAANALLFLAFGVAIHAWTLARRDLAPPPPMAFERSALPLEPNRVEP